MVDWLEWKEMSSEYVLSIGLHFRRYSDSFWLVNMTLVLDISGVLSASTRQLINHWSKFWANIWLCMFYPAFHCNGTDVFSSLSLSSGSDHMVFVIGPRIQAKKKKSRLNNIFAESLRNQDRWFFSKSSTRDCASSNRVDPASYPKMVTPYLLATELPHLSDKLATTY